MESQKELRAKGRAIAEKLGFGLIPDLAPGFGNLGDEMAFGAVWSRPGLPIEERSLAVLSALTSRQYLPQLKAHVFGALHLGHSVRTLQEVMIHCGLYSGYPTMVNSLRVIKEVCEKKGLDLPAADIPDADLLARGIETMNDLHGDRAQNGYAAPDNPVTAALYEVAIAYGYGAIWNRPDLNRRQRMICSTAAFTAIDADTQLRKFLQSALNVGLTKQELIEVVMQTGPYSGFPRALNALMILDEVLN